GSAKAAGLRIFLNGKPADTVVVRDRLMKGCGNGRAFSFGERFRDAGFKDGAVDEIRIYQRAITGLEIAALHADKSIADEVAEAVRSHNEAGLRDYYFSAIDED